MPGVQMPRCVVAMKGGLQSRTDRLFGQTLDRGDGAAICLRRCDHAGANLIAVEQHRAGTAIAGVAADLGSRQSTAAADDVGQPVAGCGHQRSLHAVQL
jgi:hypothetical protein